ncbi:MAG: phosphoribosylamine--glycine ligase [candidate division KSB1 bacterium]|nr:phosphoribosylamine--glycine ligase [candidate division KSB1 bacterium]
MQSQDTSKNRPLRVMAFGVGAFTQGVLHVLKQHGAQVYTYLTRNYAHYSPSLEGETYHAEVYPNPCPLLREKEIDFVIPMSIDWILADWVKEFLSLNIPIFSPTWEGMRLERERDFAGELCRRFDIPFPHFYVARNRLEAERILQTHPRPYVIKNPLCSPTSPVHTIICETVEDTRSWLERVDYAEGVFLQEYMGHREVGHIALVSNGEIYSLVTNQEYKRAFTGNMGIVAGAPLGGLVEKDPEDKYHLAKELLQPLLPWFREVKFHGPVQVTAIRKDNKWFVLEYNVRIGVTSGPMILQMLENPLEVLWNVVRNQKVEVKFKRNLQFGCSLTLAGYGYPYIQVTGPRLPVEVLGDLNCDVWWNEVARDARGQLYMTGHRIADVVALAATLEEAISKAYENIKKIRCVGAYYRTDIGKSLWPPGSE